MDVKEPTSAATPERKHLRLLVDQPLVMPVAVVDATGDASSSSTATTAAAAETAGAGAAAASVPATAVNGHLTDESDVGEEDSDDVVIGSPDTPDTPPGVEGGPGEIRLPPAFLKHWPRRPLSAGAMTAPPSACSPHSLIHRSSSTSHPAQAGHGFRRQRTYSTSATISTEREPIIRTSRRTIYTAGRPPWYDSQGVRMGTFVIGICGGSASGKTTVAQKIIEELDVPWVTLLSMDSFYRVLNEKQHDQAGRNEYNFDHPDAFDFDTLIETLKRLKEGMKVEVPIYNFLTHRREKKTVSMYGANVLVFEGILAFHRKEVLDLLDMKVFVDTDSDVRLSRRLNRDISQRGRDIKGVLEQYERHVKPAFDFYIAPSMAHADIIVPRGGENEVAINLIVHHVQTQMDLRGYRLREKLANHNPGAGQPLPATLRVLPETPQIKGLHTFIRNRNTSREEFIFYATRLIRLVIEYSLSLLPFEAVTVQTPQGIEYRGKKSSVSKICGVSVLRAGETMEAALTEVCQDIRLGKILIQTSPETGEAELYYLRLPNDIKDYRVILMDATVATGAAAMMAIRVLLDHEVPEENILLVSLLMAESGVHTIAYAFPKVKIVTTAVDAEINDRFHVLPGIGNFGDRFFGTEPIF